MKQIILLCMLVLLFGQSVFSQADRAVMPDSTIIPISDSNNLIQGLEAYKAGNWIDALFFLRKTLSVKTTSSDAVLYIIIMAEMNLHNYDAVLRDGGTFRNVFPTSPYIPDMTYQTILARFGLQMYNEVVLEFLAFIEQYPEHSLVSSALFWTAESLYHLYEFERSLAFYKRLVAAYPDSPKYADSIFRIEFLMQREREEELLHLLRVASEESAAAKEEYERQKKQLESRLSENIPASVVAEKKSTLPPITDPVDGMSFVNNQTVTITITVPDTGMSPLVVSTADPVAPEPVVPEPEPVVPEPKPVVPEPEPVVPEPEPVVPEPEPVAPAPEPVAIDEVTITADEVNVVADEVVVQNPVSDANELLLIELREKASQLRALLDEEEGN